MNGKILYGKLGLCWSIERSLIHCLENIPKKIHLEWIPNHLWCSFMLLFLLLMMFNRIVYDHILYSWHIQDILFKIYLYIVDSIVTCIIETNATWNGRTFIWHLFWLFPCNKIWESRSIFLLVFYFKMLLCYYNHIMNKQIYLNTRIILESNIQLDE